MAKKDRFIEGHSSSRLPPNCESEGSGSSGRIDVETNASEISAAPKRKWIMLNSDSHGVFHVPTKVLQLSRMSIPERKDWVLRLRGELEHIHVVLKKVETVGMYNVPMSSSSDIVSGNNEQNLPTVENMRKLSVLNSVPGKKLNAASNSPRGWNRGTSGRFESTKQPLAPCLSNDVIMKQCESLLKKLMLHDFGWVFNSPVDVVKLNLPDYLDVIKHPMDLGTIKKKIASSEYSSPMDFLADVRLTFSNAMTYNPPGNDVYTMANTLSKFFEVRWKVIERKLHANVSKSLPEVISLHRKTDKYKSIPPSKKRKIPPVQNKFLQEPVKHIMASEEKQIMADEEKQIIAAEEKQIIAAEEKQIMAAADKQIIAAKENQIMAAEEKNKLSRDLESILEELPDNIIEFLKAQSSTGNDAGEEEIEIDIDTLSDDNLFKLKKLLDDHLKEKQNNGRTEPCEIELLNESGLSNSSTHLHTGNELKAEDVDMGGTEPPVSTSPTSGKQKDSGSRNNKCVSPGSSSDLDSSSSDGESDVAKATAGPVRLSKDDSGRGVDMDKKENAGDLVDGSQSVSGLDQAEQTSQQKPNSVESDCCQDEESALADRPVSPNKLYRAAVLKNRFADTILKAREKTLNQGEKGDPEKLRIEREELELQKRKEKARLQAEAKAAEDARRLAESDAAAEAAAESKRQRDLEREAARQALLKMEKTVEINETSRFLQDLEKLSSVPPELLSSVEETIPDEPQDNVGNFKFGGSSNPLEQLGLYMKVDEDEEEIEPPTTIPNPVNDVEEGEID